MISLGMVKSALELYTQLGIWNEVIVCYTILELKHKAAEIIQQEIDKKPTVELYCLLGDVTGIVDWYEKALTISSVGSGRAHRHWGFYYFEKRNYEKAVPHLEKALEYNSLQEIVWARLGFAQIQLENWPGAAESYRRYTNIEQHGFESWNNLAMAYIKMGQKPRAHKILQEALKCNFNNWKIWENYLLVSVDTGEFEAALNAYQELCNLKDHYLDKETIVIIVNAIANNIPDANGKKFLYTVTTKVTK